MPDKKKEPKPGKNTTELYVTLGTALAVGLTAAFGVPVPPEVTIGALTVLASVYTGARAWVKGKAE